MRRLPLVHIHFSVSAACAVPISTFSILKCLTVAIITAAIFYSFKRIHHNNLDSYLHRA